MRATIVSVGSEILRGTLLDTNSQYFAQELQALGVEVVRATQVRDDLDAIADTLRAACETSDIVVVSGGLGPTEDDLTREAILSLTGESPTVNEVVVAQIRQRFELRGETMPERNAKQAWEAPSVQIVPNHHGTAPGWFLQHGSTAIAALPGPPRENHPMWRDYVRSLLLPHLNSQAIFSRTIKTIGLGESAVADRLGELIAFGWPEVATYAKADGVHITITAAHASRAFAEAAVRTTVQAAVDAVSGYVYGFGDDSLAAAITQPLSAASQQLAVWELGTAGTFLNMLLSDGQSQRVVGDARVWPEHALSAASARELARSATQTTGIGMAAAVVARIDAMDARVSDADVEVALAHAGSIVDRIQTVWGTPDEVRRRAALLAAEFLWTEIRSAAGFPKVSGAASPSSRT